ncbi:MAG TPA: UbiD family decarboxylase, partial [Chloroflexota bacterium]
ERGEPAQVAIVIGMDPLLTLAAGTPVPADEEGMAEFEAAGGWRGRPTELVKCETSDVLVPANAEYILEGEVRPGELTSEGPHGESVGFYGANENCWVVHINAITHRKDAINYGLICQLIEDYPRSLLRSGSFQTLLARKTNLTQIKETYFPEVGRLGMLIVRADIQSAEDPQRIMDAVWANGNWRWVIVVDEDCDVRNWNDVMWRVVSVADPDKAQVVMGQILERDHTEPEDEWDYICPARGMGIDATMKFKDQQFFPPVNRVGNELRAKVASRWSELGLRAGPLP